MEMMNNLEVALKNGKLRNMITKLIAFLVSDFNYELSKKNLYLQEIQNDMLLFRKALNI